MTNEELSEYLRVPLLKIRHLIKNNQIPYHDRLGTPRFFKQEIDEWMRSGMSKNQDSQKVYDQYLYRGIPIKKYMLTASKVLIGPAAWKRLPEFIKKSNEVFNETDRSYLLRNEFEPLIRNFNDYLRVSCQLGLIDNVREGRITNYTPTKYSEQIFVEDDDEAIRGIIKKCFLDIVKKGKEVIPQERHAIFLLWYLLKLKENGVEPDEPHFNKDGEVNYYPMIRLNFSKGLCDFLFRGNRLKEQGCLETWDKYIQQN